MLVLSRRNREAIVIGEGDQRIVVRVIDSRRGRMRIGIEAPRGMKILREEIVDLARVAGTEESGAAAA